MTVSFKAHLLNEAATVRTATGDLSQNLKAWGLRTKKANYFIYTTFDFSPTVDKIPSYKNLLFYVIFLKKSFNKRNQEYLRSKYGYDSMVDVDTYYEEAYAIMSSAATRYGRKMDAGKMFNAAGKLVHDKTVEILTFRGIHKLYNYMSLTKQMSDYSIERVFGVDHDVILKLRGDATKSDEGTSLTVMGKKIPVSDLVPKKHLKDVETAVKRTYAILKKMGLSNVYDSSRIIVTKISAGKTLALYYHHDKVIRIDPTKFKNMNALVKTLVHEFGHKIDYEHLSPKSRGAIKDVYTIAKNSRKETARQEVSVNKTANDNKIFSDHVQNLLNIGRAEIVWMKRKSKTYPFNKGDVVDLKYETGKTFIGKYYDNDAPKASGKPFFITSTGIKSDSPWSAFAQHNKKRFGIKIGGRTVLLDDYRNKKFPQKNVVTGWQVHDNSWFVTKYAKTNPAEFWAEMFAWVATGEPTRKGVTTFVKRMLRDV